MRSQLDHSAGGTVPCPDGSIRFDDAVFGGSPDPRAKSKSKVFYRLDAGVCGRIFDISADLQRKDRNVLRKENGQKDARQRRERWMCLLGKT